MTSQETAIELLNKFSTKVDSLIAVQLMIDEIEGMYELGELKKSNYRYINYWKKVKEEIEKQ